MRLTGKILAVAFIAAQLFSVLFADFGHTDFYFGSPGSVQNISNGGSGAREKQNDRAPGHSCLACYRAANFLARITSPSFVASSYRVGLVHPHQTCYRSTFHFCTESPRGPPPSCS